MLTGFELQKKAIDLIESSLWRIGIFNFEKKFTTISVMLM